jgi:phosphoribosyl-ATP pyrophosphohydrolase
MESKQMTESSIYQRAIDAFGEENQINKAIEECAEFISAVIKPHKPGEAERIVDEIADNIIMMNQMRLMFGKDVVDERIAFKLARLEQLIADKSDK